MARPILLVDDSPNDVDLALAALDRSGWAGPVAVARDGAEALTRMAARPAVVLLDLKLPFLTGLEVLRHRGADPGLRAVPVVVLTSSTLPEDVAACYAAGANAYVVKPTGFEATVRAFGSMARFWAGRNVTP